MNFPRRVAENMEESISGGSPLVRVLLISSVIAGIGLLILLWYTQSFSVGLRWGFFALSVGFVLSQFIDLVTDGDSTVGGLIASLLVFGALDAVGFIWGSKTFTIVLIVLVVLAFMGDD